MKLFEPYDVFGSGWVLCFRRVRHYARCVFRSSHCGDQIQSPQDHTTCLTHGRPEGAAVS